MSSSSKQAIKPPPKPGQGIILLLSMKKNSLISPVYAVKVYKALYDYTAQGPDELSFKENDIIYVLDMISDQNWWKAKIGNQIGLIPSNYSMF